MALAALDRVSGAARAPMERVVGVVEFAVECFVACRRSTTAHHDAV